jgi:diaminopimelate epimerase
MGVVEVSEEITVQTAGKHYRLIPVSVGNPHWVCFAEDLSAVDVVSEGSILSSVPEGGVNVEFVEVVDETTLRMRVFERGSGVTLACGTGACASVAAAVSRGICPPDTPVTVLLDGGALTVIHSEGGTTYMLGGAEFVYDGVWAGEI